MTHVLDLFNLHGKVAVVTGAARGLGRQSALALAEAGADVAICDLLEVEGKRTSAEIQALGRRSLFARVDVRHSAEADAFIARVIRELGTIDILVNNAGIRATGRSLEDEDDEAWHEMMEANLSSVFYVGRAVAKHMIERGQGGVIINMASISSLIINNITPRHNVAYCASKAGVLHLTRGMASDWAPYGIRVNAIAPGYMLTQMTSGVRENPELARRLLEATPMKRWGQDDELKGAIVFLASPASSFMTGAALVIDGGTTIW